MIIILTVCAIVILARRERKGITIAAEAGSVCGLLALGSLSVGVKLMSKWGVPFPALSNTAVAVIEWVAAICLIFLLIRLARDTARRHPVR
jgi:hypothetical protein